VNVVENVESGVKMALGWSIAVGGKEGMRRGEVGAGGLGEPPNGADDALVLPPAFHERGIRFVLVRLRACVNGKAGPIRSSIGCSVAEMYVVVFDEVRREAGLTEVYLNSSGSDEPLKVSTEKPFHGAHVVDR
jgi:hypothetical protein